MSDSPQGDTDSKDPATILAAARDLLADDRDAFLADWCGGDEQLLQSVMQLLDDELDSTDPGAPAWTEFVERIRQHGAAAGRFEELGELGRGGMGAIHRVRDQTLRRTLALKRLLPDREGPRFAAVLGRFLEEAQVTSQLDHPGIVPIHDIGVDDQSRVFFTMKLVEGDNLNVIFRKVWDPGEDGWNRTRALNTLLRVCEAMAFAHSRGVIHRDLKPANVMVGRYGETYVMDWGLAKIRGNEEADADQTSSATGRPVLSERRELVHGTTNSSLMTMDGEVVGTPHYMAPEQAEGRLDAIGPHTDVYAVGAILYHLLTGRPPYSEGDPVTDPLVILERVRRGPPPEPVARDRTVPAELVAICERAMERSVDLRYPTMEDLARDLRAFLEQRVVRAYESGPLAELRKWITRNRGFAATTAAALLTIAVILTWSFDRIRSQRDVAESNERTANEQRDRADQNALRAVARKQEFDQLSGVVLLENALEVERTLYPAWPERAGAMRSWIEAEAEDLLRLRPVIQQTILELERRGTGSGRGSESEQFLFDTLTSLSGRIEAFRDQVVPAVQQRLRWSGQIEKATVEHPDAPVTWSEIRESLAPSDGTEPEPPYHLQRIDLRPQIGLAPIGRNPATGLWEFYHLRSALALEAGADPAAVPLPAHDADGNIDIEERSGMVFVLVPGGTFLMGAQRTEPRAALFDPLARPWEAPVHEVTLEPFFISRFEITQGQWLRLTGANPSAYGPHLTDPTWNVEGRPIDLTHPVSNLSWEDCRQTLFRAGLRLPSEAQWEYAARAGTTTSWWAGTEVRELNGVCNLIDRFARIHGADTLASWEAELDDGNSITARVGSYRGNDFGLHDTIGNLWEWCLDGYVPYDQPGRAGDGARAIEGAQRRAIRGGDYLSMAVIARSSHREAAKPDHRIYGTGCRPARDLLPR